MTKPLHWIEISRSALQSNLKLFRQSLPQKTKIMSVVKANAYGHGLVQVAPIIAPRSDFLMVNTFEEAIMIRKLGLNIPVLIAAPINPDLFPQALTQNISLCVHSIPYLELTKKYPLKIHLKINTGTNRLGIAPKETDHALEIINGSKLIPEGVYTHFHSSDSGSPATSVQFSLFSQAVHLVKAKYPKCLAHCASSSAALLMPETRLDMIRLGIGLYGLWPDQFVQKHTRNSHLSPVLSWKCQIVQTRKISPGESVGYSATYIYKKNGVIAVLPVGYSDSYDRKLSNTGRVWINHTYCPVVGRIAMNFTVVDITSLKGEPIEAEIIGPHVTADDIARLTGTINYEVVSRLSPFIPRVIVK